MKRSPARALIAAGVLVATSANGAFALDAADPAVREAYVGEATAAKIDAARAGLDELVEALVSLSGGGGGGGAGISITAPIFPPPHYPPYVAVNNTIHVTNDLGLGAPGAPLVLDGALLEVDGDFSSARSVTVGDAGAIIDTNDFTLSLSGDLEANGALIKDGSGVLELTGANTWNVAPFVNDGTLRGDATSLTTPIDSYFVFRPSGYPPLGPRGPTTVEFKQEADAVFTHGVSGGALFRKTGAGTLTVTASQTYTGGTSVDVGTLRLTGNGRLGEGALAVAGRATLDLREVTPAHGTNVDVGALSGAGTIALGRHRLRSEFNTDTTFAGRLFGDGGLSAVGSDNNIPTLTFTGEGDHRGNTELESVRLALVGAGRLNGETQVYLRDHAQLDIRAADGERAVGSLRNTSNVGNQVFLGANTLILGGDNETAGFTGSISGSGGLTKVGTGNQWLSIHGTAVSDGQGGWTHLGRYTGLTRIVGGTLSARTGTSLSETVVNNATLAFALYAPGSSVSRGLYYIESYSGDISGTGMMHKYGDAGLWLRGRNSYTGGTTVSEGILLGNTDSLIGDIHVGHRLAPSRPPDHPHDDAILAFYQIENGTYPGNVSGSGTLLKYGPGEVFLTGNNSHSGGTAWSGPLRIDSDANLGAPHAPATLVGGRLELVDDVTIKRPVFLFGTDNVVDTGGSDLRIAGTISGSGGFAKKGHGTLHLNGAHSHTGATVIEQGGFSFSGSLAGSLILGADSTLLVDANPSGAASHIKVTGSNSTVSLRGGRLAVTAAKGDYAQRTRYTLISAAKVDGTFGEITTDLAFLRPSVGIDEQNVFLVLNRNTAKTTDFARTGDQLAAGRAIERLLATGGGDEVNNAFNTLASTEVAGALEAVSGSSLTSLGRVGILQTSGMNKQVGARLGGLGGDRGGVMAGPTLQLALADAEIGGLPAFSTAPILPSVTPQARHGAWLRGMTAMGHLDAGSTSSEDTRLRSKGLVGGYDFALRDDLTLGILGAYAHAGLHQDQPESDHERATAIAGLYGRGEHGLFSLDALASVGLDNYETTRQLVVGPLIRQATADFDGKTYNTHLELSYRPQPTPMLEPHVGLQWTNLNQDSYREHGADDLNLVVSQQSSDSLRSILGVRSRLALPGRNGPAATLDLGIAWAHEFADSGGNDFRLAGDATGMGFHVDGASVSRDSLLLNLGILGDVQERLSFFAELDAELNRDQHTLAISAGLRARW